MAVAEVGKWRGEGTAVGKRVREGQGKCRTMLLLFDCFGEWWFRYSKASEEIPWEKNPR